MLASNMSNKAPHKSDFKQDVVYMYQFPRCPAIPSLSPYCLKLETWLRMADIEYENVDCSPMTRSEKGLMPFVELNGKHYADSAFIIKNLTSIFHKESMEAHLTDEQLAIAFAFEQMLENSTVWTYGYIRWVEKPEEFTSEKVWGPKPFFFKLPFVLSTLSRKIKNRMVEHGIGRHTKEEIMGIGMEGLKSLSAYLKDKPYFTGDSPTHFDASIFGLLAQIVYIPVETTHLSYMQAECQNLIKYCDRIKQRFWPDWEEATSKRTLHTNWKEQNIPSTNL